MKGWKKRRFAIKMEEISNIVVHTVDAYFNDIIFLMIEIVDLTTMQETYIRVCDVEPVGEPNFLPNRRRKSKRSLDNAAIVILIIS